MTENSEFQSQFSVPERELSSLPLWRLAWRRMRRRPLQYILLIVGVAIGVAMMVSIDLANGSAQRAFQLSTNAVTGKATHRLTGGPAGLDEDVYRQVKVVAGYSPAAPVVEGYVLSPQLGAQPLRLVGIDPFAEPPFRSYFGDDAASGLEGLTAFLTEPNTIVVPEELIDGRDLALGDTLTLSSSGEVISARIVGVLQPADDASRRALSNIIFTDIASAQEMLEMTGRLSHIDLIADTDADLALLHTVLPEGVTLETAVARSNAVQQMTAAFELNLTALSLLALVVGMFLIYNTVTFSVVQRRPLFGTLRCLGVTGGQLFGLILAESTLLSLVGALLGLGLGVLLGRGLVDLVTQTLNDFYFVVNVRDVTVPAASLIKGVIVGMGAGLLASLLPAWEAMHTTPQSTLRRSTLESRAQQALPWLLLAWLVLSMIGAILLWLRIGGLVTAFAGLFAVLIGSAFLTPPLMVVLMRGLVPIGGRLLGTIGRMAPRDIVRSLSRTSVATAALMTAVSVIIGVSIMIGSFRQTVAQWLNQTLQADVYVSPPVLTASRVTGALRPEVVVQVREWPGISYAITARHVTVTSPDFDQVLELVAVDGDVSRGNRPYAWVSGDPATVWARLEAGEGVLLSETLSLKENLLLPPEPVTLDTANGPRQFPILAIFYDYSSDQGTIMIGRKLYEKFWADTAVSTVALFVEPGQQVDELVAEMQNHFRGYEGLLIRSNEGLRNSSLEIFDRTFAITAALRLLAVIVAFIGVLSALMSLQLERVRELGVLRATGMTLQQMWSLTLLQTGLMGGIAGLLAMPVGYALAWILIYVINVRSFGWTLQMQLQPPYFLQAFVIAVTAALLAGVYPSLRLGRMVIAAAIRQE